MALVEWKSRIIIRNDILANWESVNPVLSKGELSVVIGPKPQLKVGDGTTHWKDLPYINDLSNYYTKEEINGLITQLENYYSKDEINALISNYYTKEEIESKDYASKTFVKDSVTVIKTEVDKLANDVAVILGGKVKYEVVPVEGLVVDYRDTEVRINTDRIVPTHQAVGTGGNPNRYYVTFKAFAPEGAASVIEGMNGSMDAAASSLVTDAHGRNHAVIWTSVAEYKDGAWHKFGDESSVGVYKGLTFSFHWLDANGNIMQMDTVSVVFTNDTCHSDLVPNEVAKRIDAKIKQALNGDTNLDNYYTKTEVDSKFLTEEQVDAHINKIITDAVDGDTLTNLTELVEYINSHDTDIIADIANIEKQLSGISSDEGAVKAYIDNSISSLNINNYATVESLTALETVVTTKASQADLTALAAIVNGDENTEGTIKNQIKAVKDEIPTTEEIEALITGHGYTTSEQVETLINNHGFITTTEVNTKLEDYATKTWVNTELEDYVSVDDEVVLNGGAA